MGVWRGPTLRSLIEVLDRVIGRGVVVDSGIPVSPALAGLRRQATLPDEPAASSPAAGGERELRAEREPATTREDVRDPPPRRDPPD